MRAATLFTIKLFTCCALVVSCCSASAQSRPAQSKRSVTKTRSVTTAQPRVTLSLGRMIKATDKYLLTTNASYRMRHAFDTRDRVATDSTVADSIRFQALVDVTSVTETGEEFAKTLTVRYFHRYVNNVTIDVLPTGAVIQANFEGMSPVYTVNGAAPAAGIDELLRLVVRSEGGTKTGEILDPPKPVRIGESWSINKAAFAREMASGVTKNQQKGISGKVRFAGVDTLNDKPCATVIAVVRQKVGAGTRESPRQTNAYDMTISVPLDARYPTTASTVRSRVSVDARGKGFKMLQQTDVLIESTFDR